MVTNDFRNTSYCLTLNDIEKSKSELLARMQEKHSRMRNHYRYVSREFNQDFAKIYNQKCAYCGASSDIVDQFQVDHIIAQALKVNMRNDIHNIMNLAFACSDCNRRKSNFNILKTPSLHPDKKKITDVFFRNKDFSIQINKNERTAEIEKFYNDLQLGSQSKRLDFLLMNLYGLRECFKTNKKLRRGLSDVIVFLRSKRKIVSTVLTAKF